MMSFVKKFAFPLVLLASAFSLPAMAGPESINVMLDRATILRLPEKVATIVIGNPAVADGTLQTGGLLVVTGKGYGATNLLAIDRQGDTLAEYIVRVSGSGDDNKLTVYRGVERETLSCSPNCENSVMLGDSPTFFNSAATQIVSRNGNSASGGTK